jgi:hypothetical protein
LIGSSVFVRPAGSWKSPAGTFFLTTPLTVEVVVDVTSLPF